MIADYVCRGSTEAVSNMTEFLPNRFADFLPAAQAVEE